MATSPFFSVITVSLNDLPGLKLTHSGVNVQTCRDFEWLIIDGCSKDGTVEYLRAFDPSLARITIEKDSGIYDAMNKGILQAKGKYLLFMNAGDVFHSPQTLQNVKDIVHDETDILFGGACLVLPSGHAIYRPPRDWDDYIWHGLPANHQATYYKRSLASEFLYATEFRICGDYYLAAKFFRRPSNAAYLDEPLVDFKMGGLSYRTPSRLIGEPYRIQRDILHLSLPVRLRSVLKRVISLAALFVLSQPAGAWLARHVPGRRHSSRASGITE